MFLDPTAYPEAIGADHAVPLIPVPNLTLSGLCGPPVSRYPRWQGRSGVVLDLPIGCSAPISAEFLDLFDWGSFSHKGAPKRRFAKKIRAKL